jgi:hypothetical protein
MVQRLNPSDFDDFKGRIRLETVFTRAVPFLMANLDGDLTLVQITALFGNSALIHSVVHNTQCDIR